MTAESHPNFPRKSTLKDLKQLVMTGIVRYTNKAVEDLSGIWAYTEEHWSQKQADTYYLFIVSACRKLATGADIYPVRKYDEVSPGLFGYRVNKHIVFFRRVDSQTITVVRILHERMDLIKNLG